MKPPASKATDAQLRRHYEKTGLHRIGVPFEKGIEIESVRIVLEGAARMEQQRDGGRVALAA